ncbi:MAG: bifunctional phosphopantothenoylcysteine decarboxylase/phosphopantothenate--cysteine ligase CoaBC [Rhodococcus sp. (in: high G+C Gram-positive bacteria)]
MSAQSPRRRHVIVGVGGGIAAYKACGLIRHFTEAGDDVRVVPTESALQFVGRATFEALSGNPVHTGVFQDVPEVPHVRLGQTADLVVVAPATADLLSRAATGRADDLLTATLLTARCPVVFAPAMHTEMWDHPAVVENVATLRRRGITVIEPASGRLTGKDTGAGRLPEPDEIAGIAELLMELPTALPRDLEGRRVVVSAGGTREPLDPVRFLGNRSSGKQGYALARVAAQRGADVLLISGYTSELSAPAGVTVENVRTAEDMRVAVGEAAADADAVIMAAAVADFRPTTLATSKIKKGADEPDSIALTRNTDILAGLVASRTDGDLPAGLAIVGFAAETGDEHGDVLTHARQKLARKKCDLLVVNAVGEGKAFEMDDNDGWILSSDGAEVKLEHGSKALMSARVLDALAPLLSTRPITRGEDCTSADNSR